MATKLRTSSRRPKLMWAFGLAGGLSAGLLVAVIASSESFLTDAASLVDSPKVAQGTPSKKEQRAAIEPAAPKPFESALQAAAGNESEPLTNFIEPPPNTERALVDPTKLGANTMTAPLAPATGVATTGIIPTAAAVPSTTTTVVAVPPSTLPAAPVNAANPSAGTPGTKAEAPRVTHRAPVAPRRPAPPPAPKTEVRKNSNSAAAKLADEQLKAALGE